jgi:hypothetical protein
VSPKISKLIEKHFKKNEFYVEYAINDCENKMAPIISSIENEVLNVLTKDMKKSEKDKFIIENTDEIHAKVDDTILKMMIKRK